MTGWKAVQRLYDASSRSKRRITLPVVVSGRLGAEGDLARVLVRREPAAHKALDLGGERIRRAQPLL